MEIQGKIIAALEPRGGVSQRSGQEWKSQDFVLETQEQFSKKVMFTVFGADRLSRFNIQPGYDVLVAFDINAREWNGRWYNDIRAYDVRPANSVQPVSSDAATPQAPTSAPVQAIASAPVQNAQPAADSDPLAAPAGEDTSDNLPF